MLEEALTALASTGGTALVTAMVTDSWEGVKTRLARMIGRGRSAETAAVEARLEQSHIALEGLTDQSLARAQAEQEIVWQAALREYLEQDPDIEPEVRAMVAEIKAQSIGAAAHITQHVAAHENAQQAVQGQGIQNVTFGEK